MSKKVTEIVEELLTDILEQEQLELVDIEYVKEGKSWFLRIFIDKENGVDIDDCGLVSEKLGEKLDAVDPIQQNYFLEVSSPGAERPLKKQQDFIRAIGKHVNILIQEPFGIPVLTEWRTGSDRIRQEADGHSNAGNHRDQKDPEAGLFIVQDVGHPLLYPHLAEGQGTGGDGAAVDAAV